MDCPCVGQILIQGTINMWINGLELKAAVERALDLLGQSTKESILEHMQEHGFRFQEDTSYNSQEVTIYFYDLLGDDGSSVIMRRLFAAFSGFEN